MAFGSAYYVDPCINDKPQDPCWMITTRTANEITEEEPIEPNNSFKASSATSDRIKKVREGQCWEVRVSQDPCWSLNVSTLCGQNPNPRFEKDIELEEHDIFRAYAVHIRGGEIYMAVEFRPPDEPDDVYLDIFGYSGKPIQVGQDLKYAYYPSYKSTQIVDVSHPLTGAVPHSIGVGDYGYKYIITDKPEFFEVRYKLDAGFRIIRGIFSSAFDKQGHYMSAIIDSIELNNTLIGAGCSLMAHESSGLTDYLYFNAMNGNSYRIDMLGFSIVPLSTSNLNYMLTKTIALKTESKTRFYVEEDYGEPNAYPTDFALGSYKWTYLNVMQNDEITIGFPVFDGNILNYEQAVLQNLYYLIQDPESSGGSWGGVGNTGSIIGTAPYNPDKYFREPIPYPPVIPYTLPSYYGNYAVLVGMTPYTSYITDGFELVANGLMSDSIIRMNIGDDFIISTGGEILYLENNHGSFVGITVHKIIDHSQGGLGIFYGVNPSHPIDNVLAVYFDGNPIPYQIAQDSSENFFLNVYKQYGNVDVDYSGIGIVSEQVNKIGETKIDYCYYQGILVMSNGTNVLKVRDVIDAIFWN